METPFIHFGPLPLSFCPSYACKAHKDLLLFSFLFFSFLFFSFLFFSFLFFSFLFSPSLFFLWLSLLKYFSFLPSKLCPLARWKLIHSGLIDYLVSLLPLTACQLIRWPRSPQCSGLKKRNAVSQTRGQNSQKLNFWQSLGIFQNKSKFGNSNVFFFVSPF